MISYTYVYTLRAVNDIKKLSEPVKQRIKNTLERYRNQPLRYAVKLTNPELGTYRFRIGDYRVIFDLDEDKIIILRVGHRREIYRG